MIETAEERRANEISKIMKEPDGNESAIQKELTTISYVLIPHDRTKTMEELHLSVPLDQSRNGDALVEHLQPVFGSSSLNSGGSNINNNNVDLSLLQQHQESNSGASQLLGTDGMPPSVSPETLQKVAQQGHVETFALVHPTPSNQFTGVNIYLDEIGMLKRLPLNARATALAAQAGYNPPPQFYGNVFLGKTQTQPTLRNMSLTVADTAPGAPWLQRAVMENLEYQTQMNRISGKTGETQAGVDGQDGVAKTEQGYEWTQTEEEMEVTMSLPKGIVASKDVKVKFLPQTLKVLCALKEVLALRLFERVDPDGCTWTMESDGGDGKKLVLTLEKVEQAMWPRIKD